MKIRQSPRGFTLIELLVVISIIAILASMAIPAAMGVIEKGKQAQDMNNARQVGIAIKSWAIDHDGTYPYAKNQDGTTTGTPADADNSNDALANLVPNYTPNEKTFWNSSNPYCNLLPPDEKFGDGVTLSGGENGYAYVNKLNDSSNPNYPLLADAPKDTTGTYDTDPNKVGGLWKGLHAVIIRADGSAKVELVNKSTHQVMVPTGQGTSQNVFDNSGGNSSDPNNPGWLTTTNKLLVPKTPTSR